MAFNLKEKLQQAKDAGTAALGVATLTMEVAKIRAREKLGEIQDATARKTGEIRTKVGETVAATTDVIREKADVVKENAVTNLGKLGDAIEAKATQAGALATAFGKNAAKRLNLRKEEPVVAPVVQEAVKKAQKRTKKKPATTKKPKR